MELDRMKMRQRVAEVLTSPSYALILKAWTQRSRLHPLCSRTLQSTTSILSDPDTKLPEVTATRLGARPAPILPNLRGIA